MSINQSQFPMISRVLTYLFPEGIPKLVSEVEDAWTSEEKVTTTLLSTEEVRSGKFDVYVGLDFETLGKIGSDRVREDFFWLLNLIYLHSQNKVIEYCLEEFKSLLKDKYHFEVKRPWCFSNTEVVSTTWTLEFIEENLNLQSNRLSLIRRMKSKVKYWKEGKVIFQGTYLDLLIRKVLQPTTLRYPKVQERPPMRHKGYRDQGSLRPQHLEHGIPKEVLTEKELRQELAKKWEERAWNSYHRFESTF